VRGEWSSYEHNEPPASATAIAGMADRDAKLQTENKQQRRNFSSPTASPQDHFRGRILMPANAK